jgi:hypothetical protein
MAKLSVSELDFDNIKDSLKDYLRSQEEFDGFDFEGSAMNILLDVLAYNTHYNSFYLNMIANEMFMDSAALRQSVVSHAKLLGYTPRSTTSATATVNVAITKSISDATTILTLPRFTQFTSQSVDGQSFVFVSVDEKTVSNTGTLFNFTGVTIKEGNPASFVFTVDNLSNPKQIFELPDASIDTSTLLVTIQKSSTEISQRTYVLADDATEVTTNSEVYYLEEGDAGRYRIYFGDGVLGKKLDNGNLVIVSYIVTNGSLANGIENFRLSGSVLSGSTAAVTTSMKSSAGNIRETIDDVKFNAPKKYLSNNRAVTKNDYIALINRKYPYFDAVNVWGGEENIPPIYGKVFVTAKPRVGFEVTQSEKDYLVNTVLKPISVMTVSPQFVDVDYNYLLLQIQATYDPRLTSKNAGQIVSTIKNAVLGFSDQYLNTFNSTFKASRLLRLIDDSDTSIINSTVDLYIQKRIPVTLNISKDYVLEYGTELNRCSSSDERMYSTPGFTQLDASGVLRTCYIEEVPDSFTGVEEVQVVLSGRNYTSTPVLTVVGDGVGARVEAVIVNRKFKSVRVLEPGTGYTTATIQITGGGGTGAELSAIIQGRTGRLRSYYYNDSDIKTVLNENAGVINYDSGRVSILNLNPITIDDPQGFLRFNAKPKSLTFKSQRQSLTTLDEFDLGAITVNLSVSD